MLAANRQRRATLARSRSFTLARGSTWEEVAKNIVGDARPPRMVLSPCCGLESGLLALHALGMRCSGRSWDLDVHLRDQVTRVHRLHGAGEGVCIGPVDGDIVNVDVDIVPPAQIVITGPPCPPFSRAGISKGWAIVVRNRFFDLASDRTSGHPARFAIGCLHH